MRKTNLVSKIWKPCWSTLLWACQEFYSSLPLPTRSLLPILKDSAKSLKHSRVRHLISVCTRKEKIHWELWHSHRSSWNSSPPFHSLHTGTAILSPEQFYFHQILEKKKSVCLQILFTGVVHLLVHGSKVDLKKVICLYQIIQINFVKTRTFW